MSIPIVIISAIVGGLLRRAMGGWNIVPNWIEVILTLFLTFTILFNTYLFSPPTYLGGLILTAYTILYWRIGHGSYHDMGFGPLKDDEPFHWLNKLIIPKKYHYTQLYDFIGMTIRYGLPAIPFLLVSTVFPIIIGPLIAVGYLIAWEKREWFPHQKMGKDDKHAPFWNGPTATGEVISGVLFFGLLSGCIYLGV